MQKQRFWDRLFSPAEPQADTPDHLPQQTRSQPNIKRISNVALYIAGGFMLVVACVIGGTIFAKSNAAQIQAKAAETPKSDVAQTPDFLDRYPKAGVIQHNAPQHNPPDPNPTDLTVPASDQALNETVPATPPMNPYQQAQFQQWQERQQQWQQLEENRQALYQQALRADTTVYSSNGAQLATLYGGVKRQGPGTGEPVPGHSDESQPPSGKGNLLSESPDTSNYLLHTRVQAVSPFEIKAGTVIPSVMIGGVNSDLPGQILAQVSQNVYDTATGGYLLIPQGSRLVGSYDHQVVNGQKRVLVIWNRLIYPDASSVNLGAMSGTDQAGYAGFTDKTNTHFWPTFRNALMLSAITAGVQLSQPRAQKGDYSYSSQQMIAGSLGMQMNQLGTATVARGLNQPPTLTIRPGYVFNIMVNKDLILPPWSETAAHSGGAS